MWQRNYFHSIYSYVHDRKMVRCQRQYVHSKHFDGSDRSELKKNYHEEVEWKTYIDGAGGFANEQKIRPCLCFRDEYDWWVEEAKPGKNDLGNWSRKPFVLFFLCFFSFPSSSHFIILWFSSFFSHPLLCIPRPALTAHSLIIVCILHVGFSVILPCFMTSATAMTVTFPLLHSYK